jgi:hypothetical protein
MPERVTGQLTERVPHVSRFVRDVGIFLAGDKSPTSRKNREKWGTQGTDARIGPTTLRLALEQSAPMQAQKLAPRLT